MDLDEVSIAAAYVIVDSFWRITDSCFNLRIVLVKPCLQSCANKATADNSDFDFVKHILLLVFLRVHILSEFFLSFAYLTL